MNKSRKFITTARSTVPSTPCRDRSQRNQYKTVWGVTVPEKWPNRPWHSLFSKSAQFEIKQWTNGLKISYYSEVEQQEAKRWEGIPLLKASFSSAAAGTWLLLSLHTQDQSQPSMVAQICKKQSFSGYSRSQVQLRSSKPPSWCPPTSSQANGLQGLLAHSPLFESLCHTRIDPASCSQTESRCWSTPLIKSKLCTGHAGQFSQPRTKGNPSHIPKCQWNLGVDTGANVDHVYYFSVNINAEKLLESAHRCPGKSEYHSGSRLGGGIREKLGSTVGRWTPKLS